MSELKECPFCGSKADASCGEASCSLCMSSENWPIRAWNKRAMPACVRELLEMVEGYASTIFLPKCEAVREFYGERKEGKP